MGTHTRTIAKGTCMHCDESIHEDHLGRWLDTRVEPQHCPRSETGTHHPRPSSVHAHTLHGLEGQCRFCGQPVIEAADGTWHDLGDIYPELCIASASGPDRQHLPKPQPARDAAGEPLRCRHCGDEIHIGPDGKWHDTKTDDSPQWCVPSADSNHHPLYPTPSKPDEADALVDVEATTSDLLLDGDPDETERLLALGIAAVVGAAPPADIAETWVPGPMTLTAARNRLRAWSEVRG